MLSETADPPRQIYTDGRSLPKDPEPSWMGYSVGRWEGDTLVVETAGFKEASSGKSVGDGRASASRFREESPELPAGGIEGLLLVL